MDRNELLNQIMQQTGQQKQQTQQQTIEAGRTIYWVITAKDKEADKFFVGPYMTIPFNRLANTTGGMVLIFATAAQDVQHAQAEFEHKKQTNTLRSKVYKQGRIYY
jgi:hypothetical protein